MYLDGEGVKERVLTPPGPTGEGEGEEGGKLTLFVPHRLNMELDLHSLFGLHIA